MNEALRAALNHAKCVRKVNKKFLTRLQQVKQADDLFHFAHEEIFAQVNCLDCANCCKTTSPIFRNVDIDRIAQHLGIRPSALTSKYLHIDEDGDWVLNQSPCVFLNEDNTCRVYEVRPKACREYPHTDRKHMRQIMDLTYRNTLVCPAVGLMVERIKSRLSQ
ncbi:MAG: YkgJ family cysteine cluster protein [Flavobacteriales bacterium]|jgi:Fe-S-cluster containining protein